MVAEPVQATLQTLSYIYNQSTEFISQQQEKLSSSEIVDQIYKLNPWLANSPPQRYPSTIHRSTAERLWDHVLDNKWKYLTIFSIGIGSRTYIYYKYDHKKSLTPCVTKQTKRRNKRRAPKLANGARRDVVLVIGSPTVPLTRLIALDFEKRGLIVYLTILDDKDFKYVESNPITDDMNYLNLNQRESYETQLRTFHQFLNLPVIPFPGAEAHNLQLVSVVFAPNMYFPVGPIENLSPNTWSLINERLILYLNFFSSGLLAIVRNQKAKIILVNPTIASSLSMAYHAPETVFYNELRHIFTTLTRELHHQNLSVTQVRLGNLQVSSTKSTESKIASIVNSEIRSWNEDTRDLYAVNFSKSQFKANPMTASDRGASLKEFYHTLFDLVYSKRRNPALVYCGTGARSYDWISSILPESWVEYILR